jgi:hypothetical protein
MLLYLHVFFQMEITNALVSTCFFQMELMDALVFLCFFR